MATKVELSKAPYLKRLVQAAFPAYKKRTVYVLEFYSTGVQVNSYWDGGSKSEYAIVHLPTMQTKPLPTSTHPFFDVARNGHVGAENVDVRVGPGGSITLKRLPEEFVLVEAGWFCGKLATARVYVSPQLKLQMEGAA